jgi:hypothetical protein
MYQRLPAAMRHANASRRGGGQHDLLNSMREAGQSGRRLSFRHDGDGPACLPPAAAPSRKMHLRLAFCQPRGFDDSRLWSRNGHGRTSRVMTGRMAPTDSIIVGRPDPYGRRQARRTTVAKRRHDQRVRVVLSTAIGSWCWLQGCLQVQSIRMEIHSSSRFFTSVRASRFAPQRPCASKVTLVNSLRGGRCCGEQTLRHNQNRLRSYSGTRNSKGSYGQPLMHIFGLIFDGTGRGADLIAARVGSPGGKPCRGHIGRWQQALVQAAGFGLAAGVAFGLLEPGARFPSAGGSGAFGQHRYGVAGRRPHATICAGLACLTAVSALSAAAMTGDQRSALFSEIILLFGISAGTLAILHGNGGYAASPRELIGVLRPRIGIIRQPNVVPSGPVSERPHHGWPWLMMKLKPPLFNVTRGHPWLIGIRPPLRPKTGAPDFTATVSDYKARYRLKQAPTCRAEVNGSRGPTGPLRQKKQHVGDGLYWADHWSAHPGRLIGAEDIVMYLTPQARVPV